MHNNPVESQRVRDAIVVSLKGAVIASCQAGPESPLNQPLTIAALARSAELGGAQAFRVDGPNNVAAVRALSTLPILGINKVDRDGYEVRITSTLADAMEVVAAGANIVALDGTDRLRPYGETLDQIIAALHAIGVPVMADISTPAEARSAVEAGADIVATTLAGYTPSIHVGRRQVWASVSSPRRDSRPAGSCHRRGADLDNRARRELLRWRSLRRHYRFGDHSARTHYPSFRRGGLRSAAHAS